MVATKRVEGALTVGGLAFLWPLLHASPYFPVSLAFNSATSDVSFITGCHSVYTLLFVLLGAAFVVAPGRLGPMLGRFQAAGLVLGALGTLGCALLMACGSFEPSTVADAGLGCGMALVALFIVCAVVAWGEFLVSDGFARASGLGAASYGAFSVVWLLWVWLAPAASWLLAASPLVSGACLTALRLLADCPADDGAPAATAAPSPDASFGSAVRFPHAVVWPCVALVYAAVTLVRVFTTMQAGMSVGALSHDQQMLSALIQVVVVAVFALVLRVALKKGVVRCGLTVMGVLVLLFLAALLQVMLTGAAQESSFTGRRALVAVEHCLEVLLFVVLASVVQGRASFGTRAFACFAVGVLAVPQFLSLDLMYRTGVLDALAHIDLMVPVAAIASFSVAALLVGMLTAFASRAPYQQLTPIGGVGEAEGADGAAPQKPAAHPDPDDWQADLCRKALAQIDVSPREFDVVVLAYRGYSSRNIAHQLAVSESTVKTHLTHVYRKLGIHSRQDLISLIDKGR